MMLQLVDGHSLFEYSVGMNEIIQIMVKPAALCTPTSVKTPTKNKAAENTDDSSDKESYDKENKEVCILQIYNYKHICGIFIASNEKIYTPA